MIGLTVMQDALSLAATLERMAFRKGISVSGRIFMRDRAGAIRRVYREVQENPLLVTKDIREQQFCWQVKFELDNSDLKNDQFLQELDFLADEMASVRL